jgi:thiamine pyrophosphokinase
MEGAGKAKRGVLVGHGRFSGTAAEQDLLQRADLVVAADGGALYAWQAGRRADVVVGDWDSLGAHPGDSPGDDPECLRGARIVSVPREKDETDLELALGEAVRQGCTEVVFLGALGGRLDQSLANLQLLVAAAEQRVRASIVEGRRRVWLLSAGDGPGRAGAAGLAELEFTGQPGEYVSLLPVTAVAGGVWTEGLRYPLAGEELWLGKTRGISNEFLGERAKVRVGSGRLLVVVPGVRPGEEPAEEGEDLR